MVNLSPIDCCGCASCLAACPVNAIKMIPDKIGALYPKIDMDKCVQCSLCEKVCPELVPKTFNLPVKVFAVVAKPDWCFFESASGGLATALSIAFIRQGGIIYGCSMLSLDKICHIRVDSEDKLYLLQGSKYVHGDMSDSFKSVLEDLKSGLKVMFIGTPCQVGALKSFLRKDYENLVTVDLICHGVPPLQLLRSSIRESFTKYRNVPDSLCNVFFRWKIKYYSNGVVNDKCISYGVKFGIKFGIKNTNIVSEQDHQNSPYMSAFLTGLSYRENCHHCQYAKPERVADITIGDFWGLGEERPSKFNCHSGVSIALINTLQGNSIFNLTSNMLDYEERDLNEAKKINTNLNKPSIRPLNKDLFWSIYVQKGLKAAMLKCDRQFYIDNNWRVSTSRNVSSCLKNIPGIYQLGHFLNRFRLTYKERN